MYDTGKNNNGNLNFLNAIFLIQVTSLVHMPNGQVYDPLIGQWMTPNWESILHRVASPNHLHLYRFNGNDPINVHAKKIRLTGE